MEASSGGFLGCCGLLRVKGSLSWCYPSAQLAGGELPCFRRVPNRNKAGPGAAQQQCTQQAESETQRALIFGLLMAPKNLFPPLCSVLCIFWHIENCCTNQQETLAPHPLPPWGVLDLSTHICNLCFKLHDLCHFLLDKGIISGHVLVLPDHFGDGDHELQISFSHLQPNTECVEKVCCPSFHRIPEWLGLEGP